MGLQLNKMIVWRPDLPLQVQGKKKIRQKESFRFQKKVKLKEKKNLDKKYV